MKFTLFDIFESIDAFKKIAKERSKEDTYIKNNNHIVNQLTYSKWLIDLCEVYNNGKIVDLSPENMQKKFDTDKELQKSFFNILFNFIKKNFEGKFGLSNFSYEFDSVINNFSEICIYFRNFQKKKKIIGISINRISEENKNSSLLTISQKENSKYSTWISEHMNFTWTENHIIEILLYFIKKIFDIACNPSNRYDVFIRFIQKIMKLQFYLPIPGKEKKQTVIVLKDIQLMIMSLFIRNFFLPQRILYDKLEEDFEYGSIDNCVVSIYKRGYQEAFLEDTINYFKKNIRNNSKIFLEMIIDAFNKTKKFDTDIMLEDNFSQARSCVEEMMKKVMQKATGIDNIEVVYEK